MLRPRRGRGCAVPFSVAGMREQLITKLGPWWYVEDLGRGLQDKWTHLQCFVGGMLILGGDPALGMDITDTCVHARTHTAADVRSLVLRQATRVSHSASRNPG